LFARTGAETLPQKETKGGGDHKINEFIGNRQHKSSGQKKQRKHNQEENDIFPKEPWEGRWGQKGRGGVEVSQTTTGDGFRKRGQKGGSRPPAKKGKKKQMGVGKEKGPTLESQEGKEKQKKRSDSVVKRFGRRRRGEETKNSHVNPKTSASQFKKVGGQPVPDKGPFSDRKKRRREKEKGSHWPGGSVRKPVRSAGLGRG